MHAELSLAGAATRIDGPLLFLRRMLDVGLNESVEVVGIDGRARLGRIAALDEEFMTVEVLEATQGLTLAETRVRFHGEPLHLPRHPRPRVRRRTADRHAHRPVAGDRACLARTAC